jgi:hypothetical protein
MTTDDIISIALEAKLPYEYDTGRVIHLKELERFAALIEERLSYDGIHTCHDQCQRPACVETRRAVEREREACAKVVEDYPHWIGLTAKAEISNAIRARGQQ